MREAKSQRVCFLMHLKPDRVQDYLAAHTHVWPEMLEALRDAGWRNYSLFVREADGLVVGYLETDDFERAKAEMAASGINARWQESMAPYFADSQNPDASLGMLAEYFHLA